MEEQLSDVHIVSDYSNMSGSAAAGSCTDSSLCHQAFSNGDQSRGGCWRPGNRCAFLRFCGMALCEMMNNLNSKGEMMIASLCDEVNKRMKQMCFIPFFSLPPLFLHPQSHGAGGDHQAYLRSTSLETPQGCVHVHVCVHARIQVCHYASRQVMLFNSLLDVSFFCASFFLSVDTCCCVSE